MKRSYCSLSSEVKYLNLETKEIFTLPEDTSLQTYFNANSKVCQLQKISTGQIIFNLQKRGS